MPSSTSKKKAIGASPAAQKKYGIAPVAMNTIAQKTLPTPQAALASVMKSATWKSRSMEKWRCMGLQTARGVESFGAVL